MSEKIRDLISQKRLVVTALIAIACIVLTFWIMLPGINVAKAAHNSLILIQSKYENEEIYANNISTQQAAYEQAYREFQFSAQPLFDNVDTGEAIKDISQYVKDNNVQLISIKPGVVVVGAYEKHLDALPITMEIQGSFPDILASMQQMENNGNPGEFRSVKIATNKDTGVTADLILVLYSTDQPMVTDYVTAPSGSYNPFQPLKQPVNQSKLPLVSQLLKGGTPN